MVDVVDFSLVANGLLIVFVVVASFGFWSSVVGFLGVVYDYVVVVDVVDFSLVVVGLFFVVALSGLCSSVVGFLLLF